MKMKNVLLPAFAFGFLISASAAYAEGEVDPVTTTGGQVTFNGEITIGACSVASDDTNKIVNLDTVRSSVFTAKDQVANARKPFTISLQDCDTTTYKNVSVSFTGQADATSPNLLANNAGAGAATNVGLQIYGPNNEALALGTGQTAPVALNEGATSTINFAADYVSTAAVVGAGKVQSVANFMLTYN